MKKHLKSLLVLALVVPCLILFSACSAPTKMADGDYMLYSLKLDMPGVSVTVNFDELLEYFGDEFNFDEILGGLLEGEELECTICEGSTICPACEGDGCSLCDDSGVCYNCKGTGIEPSVSIGIDFNAVLGFLSGDVAAFTVSGNKFSMPILDSLVGESMGEMEYTLTSKGIIKIDGEELAFTDEEMGMSMSVKYTKNKITMSVEMQDISVKVAFKKAA